MLYLQRLPIARDLSPSKEADKESYVLVNVNQRNEKKNKQIILNSNKISRSQLAEPLNWQFYP